VVLDLDYEQGLTDLKKMLRGTTWEQEFHIYEARLRENLHNRRLYGPSSNNDVERYQILDSLNHFTNEHFAIQFIDLCRPRTNLLQSAQSTPSASEQQEQNKPQASPPVFQTWQGGTESSVKGATYIIHEPITASWTADRSVLYQRAKAQEVGINRIVWLKQLQIQRASSAAANWRTALSKEERLLNILEQEQYDHFPRRLAFESTTYTTTLVHTASQGRTWAQSFPPPDLPLDTHMSHMLLRSSLSLCAMLRVLHHKHFYHRALAPDNILYINGAARLQDVGRATWRYEPGEGPELYRAPEQRIANKNLAAPGPYTDVYQLGMILYHYLGGHLPASVQQIVPLRTWNATLSPEIDVILQRAIAFNVKERWPTITDFSAALRKALS
jgi:serine/threonine protein kinase